MPSNALLSLDLLWGKLRFLFGPTPVCSCLQRTLLSELVCFLLWELSMTFYIFHRHRVCLVDCVDLICSLHNWWEGFESSSLATLPLGFICGFTSTSTCESSTGVCSWGCPGGPGFAPGRARCGGGAAAWVTGVLAAPGSQGSWRLGQQELWCSRRAWQPVLANMLQYSCLENPLPDRESWQATVYRLTKSWTRPKWLCAYRCKTSFACGGSAQWELGAVVQLLGLRGPWHQVQGHGLSCHRSYRPIRVFFQASYSWWSEGLFGPSFSVAPLIQALRGLSCLGSFSAVWCIRHTEGSPGSVHQAFDGPASLLFSCGCWPVGRQRLWGWLHPYTWQQYRLASMPAWLSSSGISHHCLLPHIPSIHLSTVNSSPHPGIAPWSLNSSLQLLHIPGEQHSCLGYVRLQQGLSDAHSI